MSYPYYYNPSYSHRLYEPTLHAQHTIDELHRSYLREEQRRIHQALRLQEDSLARQRVLSYEQELKDKQRMSQLIDRNRLQSDIKASSLTKDLIEQRKIKDDYLQKIGSQRKQYERNIENRKLQTERKRQPDRQNKKLTETYQEELLAKLRSKENTKRQQQGNNINWSNTRDKVAGISQPIINRKPDQKSGKKQLISFSNAAINANLQPVISTDKKYGTLDIPNGRTSNKQTSEASPLKDKYATYRPKSQQQSNTHHRNKSTTHRKGTKANAYFDRQSPITSNYKKTNQIGLKKIQNRVKVSSIIYKDSSLPNKKHELQHLHNTYQTELRLRKQIKDKINSHPQVLKKHGMVVL